MSHDLGSTPLGGDGVLGLRVFPEGCPGPGPPFRAVLAWQGLLDRAGTRFAMKRAVGTPVPPPCLNGVGDLQG